MDTGRQALILFYAVFWAAALSVTGRYQPFDTPSMMARDGRAWRRFWVSLLILNVCPVVWLIILYLCVIPNKENIFAIVAAAIGSLTVFGWHRILHAFIASERFYRTFYTDEQVKEVRNREKFDQPQTFKAHLIPGVFYIGFFSSLAWLISYCVMKHSS